MEKGHTTLKLIICFLLSYKNLQHTHREPGDETSLVLASSIGGLGLSNPGKQITPDYLRPPPPPGAQNHISNPPLHEVWVTCDYKLEPKIATVNDPMNLIFIKSKKKNHSIWNIYEIVLHTVTKNVCMCVCV